MSVVVAEGVVEVTADGSDIPRQIGRDVEANGSAVNKSGGILGGHLNTGIGGALATTGRVVGAALIGTAVAVGVGVGAIVTNGIKFNAAMESYVAAFTPLLGGADAAKAKLQDLSTMAASTPFQLTDLAGASQTLLAFGEDTNALLPDLTMLGNISQGNSEKLSGLALVFGQVQSNGHLMGQDLLQMINQGFNPLQIISDKTGESMASLRDRMEKGQISFDEVRGAMVDATSEGGMFFNAMELGAHTLTGAWSSTQDGANILSGAIVGKLSPALTGILNDGINPLLGGLLGLVNGTEGAQETVNTASASLLTGIQAIVPAIGGIATNLSTVFTAIAPALGAAVGAIISGLVTILPSLIGLAGQIVTTLVTTLAAQGPQLVTAAVPVILGFVMGLVSQLPTLVSAGLGILVALISGVTDAIPELIPVVVDAILDTLNVLFEGGGLESLLNAGLKLLVGLQTGILNALPGLIAALPGIIQGIVGFLTTAIPQLVDAGVDLLLALVEALPDIITGIVAAIPQIIVGLVTALVQMQPKLMAAGVKLLLGLVENLPAIIISLQSAMPQIVLGLVKVLSSPSTIAQFASAGGQMITGLWNGISNLAGWINSKVSGFLNNIVKNVKSFLGIKSPSTLFASIGNFLGQGLALGISATEGIVSAAATGLGLAASKALGIGTSGTITVTGGPDAGLGGGDGPSFPGGPDAPVGGGSGGSPVYIDKVVLDAKNVQEFSDVVDMVQALPQVARAGKGDS